MPFYFPHSLKVSPRSRHQQIWCLMRGPLIHWQTSSHCNLSWQEEPWLSLTSFTRTLIPLRRASPSRFHQVLLHSHLPKAPPQSTKTMKVRISTDEFGLRRHVDRNIQSIADGSKHNQWSKRRNTWNSGRNDSNWPENVVLRSINHKSTQRSSRVVWNVKSESWGLLLQAEEIQRVHQTSSVQRSGC